jgi:hypothetical protein
MVEQKQVEIDNPRLEFLLGGIQFTSITFRLVKVDGLERRSEDYGQAVVYLGSIAESPTGFVYDDEHYFLKGKVQPVCRNTYRMLHGSRFAAHFQFFPEMETGKISSSLKIFMRCTPWIPEHLIAGIGNPAIMHDGIMVGRCAGVHRSTERQGELT